MRAVRKAKKVPGVAVPAMTSLPPNQMIRAMAPPPMNSISGCCRQRYLASFKVSEKSLPT